MKILVAAPYVLGELIRTILEADNDVIAVGSSEGVKLALQAVSGSTNIPFDMLIIFNSVAQDTLGEMTWNNYGLSIIPEAVKLGGQNLRIMFVSGGIVPESELMVQALKNGAHHAINSTDILNELRKTGVLKQRIKS